MLPKIRKILYSTDLSENSKQAFSYAVVLANALEADITVLYIIEDLSVSGTSMLRDYLGEGKWSDFLSHRRDEYRDTIRQRINAFCEEVDAEFKGCPLMVTETLIQEGNPAECIIREANSGDYDMVVMGTHGRGAVSNALMGNTARRVVRRCSKPVTVVRLTEK
jgi:nucleotide-binding universal stress UspA family protein